jgi:hypothetical protein
MRDDLVSTSIRFGLVRYTQFFTDYIMHDTDTSVTVFGALFHCYIVDVVGVEIEYNRSV